MEQQILSSNIDPVILNKKKEINNNNNNNSIDNFGFAADDLKIFKSLQQASNQMANIYHQYNNARDEPTDLNTETDTETDIEEHGVQGGPKKHKQRKKRSVLNELAEDGDSTYGVSHTYIPTDLYIVASFLRLLLGIGVGVFITYYPWLLVILLILLGCTLIISYEPLISFETYFLTFSSWLIS